MQFIMEVDTFTTGVGAALWQWFWRQIQTSSCCILFLEIVVGWKELWHWESRTTSIGGMVPLAGGGPNIHLSSVPTTKILSISRPSSVSSLAKHDRLYTFPSSTSHSPTFQGTKSTKADSLSCFYPAPPKTPNKNNNLIWFLGILTES